MRPDSTGKSDPQQPAPTKRGFFAAAGERLKRAMSGARAPAAAAPNAQEASDDANDADDANGEATTSVQAKARELLQHDRTHRRGEAPAPVADDVTGARQRRTSPPPLPSQRMAADAVNGSSDRASTSRPKRPVRDSKSDALRARLGAAKAALAEAQAKRAAEQASATEATAQPEDTKLEIATESTSASAAESASDAAQPQPPTAATPDSDEADPIRTLTIARLLARQGYYDRSLSIYDELLTANAGDSELRAEADQVRAKQSSS